MQLLSLIFEAFICIAAIGAALFFRTDNRSANIIMFFVFTLLGTAIFYQFFGTKFILEGMSYHEASKSSPVLYERYQNCSVPFILIFGAVVTFFRWTLQNGNMFAAK